DMIGRMKDSKLVIGGVGTATEWRDTISTVKASQTMSVNATEDNGRILTGIPIVISTNGRTIAAVDPSKKSLDLTLQEDGYGPSDHSSFYSKQIPVLFFWTGTHNDYHKPSDTAEKMKYQGEWRIVSFVASIARDIDKSDKRPTYTVAKSESQGR